ncbi:mercuric transporter MerT family protein [Agaribacterium sp. ZY112]|uniref:mercuric transporter MerT family protein n=1 Tax=Agaribacterium sp. ZY112 TaxID=3233574 RepID=UPI0035267E41
MQKTSWSLIAGVAAAFGASLCCAGPLILLSVGISGAWIANLTELEPYRPLFIAVVVALFGWAGWRIFKSDLTKQDFCIPGEACAQPRVQRNRKLLYFVAVLVAMILIFSPYWVLFFA